MGKIQTAWWLKMKSLYRMNFDCGRQGSLSGIFVEDDEDVALLISSEMVIVFGEVLGKHSHIAGTLTPSEIVKITDDEKVISIFDEFELESGFNPFDYPVGYEWKESKGWRDDITVCEGIEILKKGN